MSKQKSNFWRLGYSSQSFLEREEGISLIEVIISVVVIAILAVGVMHSLLPYRQEIALDEQAGEISDYLELARVKSIGMTNNKAWGVHLENPDSGSDYFEFYSTVSDYTEKNVAVVIYLSWGTEFSSPVTGSSSTIQFTKDTGEATISSVAIIAGNGNSRTINANSEGVISVSEN